MCYPLLEHKSFVNDEVGIALFQINPTDCHIGLYWCYNESISLFHFISSQTIVLESATEKHNYRFEKLKLFDPVYIPTLVALAPKIQQNKLNLFKNAVRYDGYKFDLVSGDYLSPNHEGNHLNCAAFTLALLSTFNIKLIDWETWPEVSIPKEIMEEWLMYHKLDSSIADSVREKNREIRGKQVGAAVLSTEYPVALNDIIDSLIPTLDNILISSKI